MKKIVKILITASCVIALLIPSMVSAYGVCNPQKWYAVSYFDEGSNWVTQNVSAWTADGAAFEIGLDAGIDSFVGCLGVNPDPVQYDWKVSRMVDGVWAVEIVTATSQRAVEQQLGIEAGRNCWITKVF